MYTIQIPGEAKSAAMESAPQNGSLEIVSAFVLFFTDKKYWTNTGLPGKTRMVPGQINILTVLLDGCYSVQMWALIGKWIEMIFQHEHVSDFLRVIVLLSLVLSSVSQNPRSLSLNDHILVHHDHIDLSFRSLGGTEFVPCYPSPPHVNTIMNAWD